MTDKIIAQTIAGASEHFIELINEDGEVSETHLNLKSPIDILVEDPTASVNTFICHNPMDVLLYSLWVLTGCRDQGRIEKILGRPVRPLTGPVLTYTNEDVFCDAGRFQIKYRTRPGNLGSTRLDASIVYKSADAYEFLIEDFGAVSLCLQYLAAKHGFAVGRIRISVSEPSVHKEHVDSFYWDADGWSIGLHNFYLADLGCNERETLAGADRLISEAHLAMELGSPIGIRTKFLRRVAIPAMTALLKINEQELDDARYFVESMPRMLDWSVASERWFSEVFGKEFANHVGT